MGDIIIIADYDRSLFARRLWEGTSIFRNARDSRRRRFRAVYDNRISNALCTRIVRIEFKNKRIKLSRFTSDYIISLKTSQYISYDPYFEAMTSLSIMTTVYYIVVWRRRDLLPPPRGKRFYTRILISRACTWGSKCLRTSKITILMIIIIIILIITQ